MVNVSSILHTVTEEVTSAQKKVALFLSGGALPISSWHHLHDKILSKTFIIAHRGASGYLPEHSIPAYKLAIDLGTDYIEPDLVISKDGVFVALHDLLLDSTTNVATFPQFQDRKTTKEVEGLNMTGYFVDDFLMEELRLLRVRQRLGEIRPTYYDNMFPIPQLSEIFALAQNETIKNERQIGLYIELKHPQYYKGKGKNMEDLLLSALRVGGYETKGVVANLMGKTEASPIIIQCFDVSTLGSLRSKCDLPLIQLVNTDPNHFTVSALWTNANLDVVQQYANGLGPPLSFFTAEDTSYAKGLEMITQAAERNLVVHPWQLQSETRFVSKRFEGNAVHESLYFVCCLEMQGIFTEFPDQTRLAIESSHNDAKLCTLLCPTKFPNTTSMHKEWAKELAKDCAMPEKMGLLIAAVVILGIFVVVLGAAACCTAEFMKTRKQLAELVEEGKRNRHRNREYEMVSVNESDSQHGTDNKHNKSKVVQANDDE